LGPKGRVVFSKNKNQKLLTSVLYASACQLLCRLQVAYATTYSGKKINFVVSFYSSQPPLHPYIMCILVGPPIYHQHPIFSLFIPRNMCLTLHIFISAPSSFFSFDFIPDFFISIFFVLIHFSNLLLFSIASSFNFFYQIWSSIFFKKKLR
jgi:hypothetical protein